MIFPKKVMKTSELEEMGFPRRTLLSMAHKRGQTYAFRENSKGAIYWDTDKLKRELDRRLVR